MSIILLCPIIMVLFANNINILFYSFVIVMLREVFFVCIDAISHLSTGDRNDKLRLRDRLTLLLCCNCICRKEVQHYGILVQSPTLSDFFCTWYFADVEFRPVSGAFLKFCYISLHIFLQLNSIQFTNSTMVYLLWIPATYLFLLNTKLEIKC